MPRIAVPDLSLTDRELQVLAYQSCLPPTSIGEELGMSPRMLQRHMSAITRKVPATQGPIAPHDTSDIHLDDSGWPFA